MMASSNVPYRTTGSTVLHPLSQQLHISLDQVNFVACQLFALVAAIWFRIYLSPRHAHAGVRHAFATLLGVYFAVFCFGWYSLHIFTLILLCYCIMVTANIGKVHRYSFVTAMGYLTLCQINRVYIFNYGILSTDFSGPLMIITQKITSLAFQLHDGMGRNAEELTSEQRQYAVKKMPSLLEYLSYHLNFMSILAGPSSNFQDYVEFIEGRHIQSKLFELKLNRNGYNKLEDPSPNEAVIQKLCITFFSLILFLTFAKAFPVMYVIDDKYINKASFIMRLSYLYIAMQASRPKYYFAWTLADAVNNAAGFGFSGIDENGRYRWDLISSLNIWNIETATSIKMYIENWNIQTAAWLKRVCYDRVPRYRTGLTFLLSALWHGVYPGYYFTFLTGIPVMLAARVMRNNFRHHFISSKPWKFLYDLITWIVTQLAICYTAAPFVLLALEPTFKFYKSFYFCFHIVCILILVLLPGKPQSSGQRKPSKQTTQNATNHMKEKKYIVEQGENHSK